MGRNEWQPIPAYVPNLPTEPPPDRYPQKKAPELDDHPRDDEKRPGSTGSTVVNGKDSREDDRFDDKIKDDDEM